MAATSYQKLKAENKKLKKDIFWMVMNPNSVRAIIIKNRWKMIFELEMAVWKGNPITPNPPSHEPA